MREPFLFRSSRGEAPACAFSQAVLQGLAPDGGLYVPLGWPRFTVADFATDDTLPAIASRLLAPFLAEDVLATELAGFPRDWSLPPRSGNSPAGAATCARSRCGAPSMTASGS